MVNINVHLDRDIFFKFRNLKDTLKCKTNEELLSKIIKMVSESKNLNTNGK